MPTPITITQLENASLDVQTIERVSNDLTNTTTTRNGGTIDTLYGALSKLKYSVPIAFTTGIVVNVATITVLQAGVVYAPLLSAIPFTTTGSFNGSQWYPIAPTFSVFVTGITNSADAAAFRTAIGAAASGSIDLNVLTTDSTGGALADLFPFVDASESNASNKATLPDILKTLIPLLTADATPDLAADHVISFDTSATLIKKVLLNLIGAGKHTAWIPSGAMISRTTTGAASNSTELATNKVMVKTLDFDAATEEFAQFQLNMPKGWNVGTFTAVFVWSHPATTTNFSVVWKIAALATGDDDALDTAFGTAVTVIDVGGTTNDIYRSAETGAITASNTPAANDIVTFQVSRLATDATNDTLAVDARLHGVLLVYTTNVNTDN